jgi:hypothetical protein
MQSMRPLSVEKVKGSFISLRTIFHDNNSNMNKSAMELLPACDVSKTTPSASLVSGNEPTISNIPRDM